MSINQGAGDVTLSVEFAGICLYVIDRRKPDEIDRREPETTVVRVLIPTCLPINGVSDRHEDGDTGARHVPYLLVNLANLGLRVPPGLPADGPKFGVVRRLIREEIFFDVQEREPKSIELEPDPLPLPDLSIYKPAIRLKDRLLSNIQPNDRPELNVRALLRGGTLAATTFGGSGRANEGVRRRDPDWDRSEADWAGSIAWTRRIPAGSLTIRIRSWDNPGEETSLTLSPFTRGGREVIELKIADLCETNPLEWREFEPRFNKDDVDFKWLFRLFEASDRSNLLDAVGRKKYFGVIGPKKFPYPKLEPRGARPAGYSGCTGGQFGLP